jgi:anti-sigma-K factor RskA
VSGPDHSRWSDDVPAYVLGALTKDEASELERHLESCEPCRQEVRWLMPAAESLPESIRPLEPPERLRERLMAVVREDAARAADGGDLTGGRHAGRGRLDRFGLGSLGWRGATALGALVLILAAVLGYAIGNNGSGGGEEEATTVRAGHAPGVTARVITEDQEGTLLLAHVHQPPRGDILEAWVERGGRVEAVPDLFTPNRVGRASTTIADMNGVATVMVTYEPSGGTEAPTTTPIIAVPIPNPQQ